MKRKLLNSKKDLMIMIFANLITQLGITYYVMTNTKVTKDDKNKLKFLLLFIIYFIILYFLAMVPMPSWLKFILFSVFSYIWGILLAYLKLRVNDYGLINIAMLGSIGIFGINIIRKEFEEYKTNKENEKFLNNPFTLNKLSLNGITINEWFNKFYYKKSSYENIYI